MPIPREDHKTISTFKGVNVSDPNHVIDDKEFETVENLIISDTGDLVRRKPLRYFALPPDAPAGHVGMLGIFFSRILYTSGDTIYLTPVDTDLSNTDFAFSGAGEDAHSAVLYNKNVYVWSNSSAPSLTGFTVSDWTVDAPTIGAATLTGTPPDDIIKSVIFKDRCFAIKNPQAQSSRVFFSEITDPGNWQANGFFDVVPGDGDYITDILPFGERLFIFKRNATYYLIPAALPASWIVKLFDNGIGAAIPYAVLEYRGLIYTLSLRGLYRSDGVVYDYAGYSIQKRWETHPINIDLAGASPNFFITLVDDYLFIYTGTSGIGHWFYNPVQNAWTECIFPSTQIAEGALAYGIQGYLKNGTRGTWFGWLHGTNANVLWFGLQDPDHPANADYSDYVLHHATPGSRVITPIHTTFKSKSWDNGAFYRVKRHKYSTLEMTVPAQEVVGNGEFRTHHNFDLDQVTNQHEFLVLPNQRGTLAHKIPGCGYNRRLQLEFDSDTVLEYIITGYDLDFFNKRTLSENPQ